MFKNDTFDNEETVTTRPLHERMKKLSDEELISIVKEQFMDYTYSAVTIAKDELLTRGIELALWYYRKDGQQFGPLKSDEIKKLVAQEIIQANDYVWRFGIQNWVPAYEVDGLFKGVPPIFPGDRHTQISPIEIQVPDSVRTGIRLASIFQYVNSGIWSIIWLFQIINFLLYENTIEMAILVGWNLVWIIASFAIAIGLWMLRKWAIGWGIGTSALGVIWYLVEATTSPFFFIIVLIEIAILILILINKRHIKSNEEIHNEKLAIDI